MAVLNDIRKHGIFLIVIIALALFAFILSSVIKNGGFNSGKSQRTIGIVNGQDISRIDFSNKLENAQKNSRRNLTTVQAVNQVWEGMIQQTLLQQQIKKLGLAVGQPQINQALATQFGQNPNFTTNGQFDINKLSAYVNQLQASAPQLYQQWLQSEKGFINQAKSTLYLNLVRAGAAATPAEAKAAYELKNTNFDLQYIKIPYTRIDSSKVLVSNEDINAYIQNHQSQFKSEGSRDIRYILFEEKASPADSKEIKQSLTQLLNNHQTYNEAAGIKETVKGFKTITNYDEYLSENSDLPFDNLYHFKSALPGEFADTLFNLKKGEVFGPYKNNGFWKYSKLISSQQIPDSVQAKHILITFKGTAIAQREGIKRTQPEAEALADSLLNILKNNPEDFASLATKYSNDPNSKTKGGDLGWLTYPENTTNPFIDYIFNHQQGQIGVVKTQYGYHIVAIEATKDPQQAVKLATLAKKIEPSENTMNALFNETTHFQMAAQDSGFTQAANSHSYKIRPVKNLGPMAEHITGIGNHRDIVQWAYKEETALGSIKRFEIGKGYVVAQLTGKTSKGLESAKEASPVVKPILLKKKKSAYIKKKVNGKSLEQIAGNFGTQVRTIKGVSFSSPNIEGSNEPKVIGRAYALNTGQTSAPIAGNNGVYLIKLSRKNVPADMNSYKSMVTQETAKNQRGVYQNIIKALKSKATIKDKRAKFY